jgi:hypothetical protein
MVDVKNNIVSILTLGVTVLLGGSGLVDYIISEKPSVFIAVVPDNNTTDSTATVEVTNRGSAPATHLKLKLDAPGIIDDYDVDSTEDYEVVFKNSTSLVLNIPRFIHGEGSIVKVYLKLENILSSGSDDYIAYATYDQGSFRVDVPAIQPQLKTPLPIQEQITLFWNSWGDAIMYFIYAIIALVSGLIIDKLYRKNRSVVLIEVSPKDNSTNVPTDTDIKATFDKPLDRSTASTIDANTFFVSNPSEIIVLGVVTVAPGNRTIKFKPAAPLEYYARYKATIAAEIKSLHDYRSVVHRTWSFTTAME